MLMPSSAYTYETVTVSARDVGRLRTFSVPISGLGNILPRGMTQKIVLLSVPTAITSYGRKRSRVLTETICLGGLERKS